MNIIIQYPWTKQLADGLSAALENSPQQQICDSHGLLSGRVSTKEINYETYQLNLNGKCNLMTCENALEQ